MESKEDKKKMKDSKKDKKESKPKKSRKNNESDEEINGTGTFNDLEVRFQLKPEHDENYIFPEELDMIKEIRVQLQEEFRDELSSASDKFMLTFLLARRHNMKESVELLKYVFFESYLLQAVLVKETRART